MWKMSIHHRNEKSHNFTTGAAAKFPETTGTRFTVAALYTKFPWKILLGQAIKIWWAQKLYMEK